MDSRSRGSLPRALASLEHRDFRLLFLSSVAAGVGGHMQNVSNAWQIYALTGSALHLGLTGIARAIPILLFSLIGGVIADRMDRRKIIIFTQAVNGAFALVLAVLSLTGLVDVWHIYAVVFLNSTLMSASAPARRAVIATVVPRHHLMNAFALNSLVMQVDKIAAPAVAGILIALVGTSLTYAINGIGHMITAASLVLVSAVLAPQRIEGSPLKNLVEGLAFVRLRSIILVLLSMDAAAMLFGGYTVLLPIFADRFGVGAIGFGVLTSAPAVGSLLAATVLLSLGDFRYKGYLIAGAILGYCACLVGLALSPWFLLALVAAAGLGLTDSLQAISRNAVIQLLTPDELRGRVSAFQHMLQGGTPALGQGIMGAAAGALGTPLALVGGAVICAAINVGMLVRRGDLRAPHMDLPADLGKRITIDAEAVRAS